MKRIMFTILFCTGLLALLCCSALAEDAILTHGATDSLLPAEERLLPTKGILEPLDDAGQPVDTENGLYWANIIDVEHIDDGGFFTAELYEEDRYAATEVEALQPGDRVRLNGKVYTVSRFEQWLSHEDVFQLTPEENFEGWMGFEKGEDGYYYGTLGSWHVTHYMTDVQVMLPLPYAFSYVFVASEDDVTVFDADHFLALFRNDSELVSDLSSTNTVIQFADGLVTGIIHEDW